MKKRYSLKKLILYFLITFSIVMPIVIGIIVSFNFYNENINTLKHNQKQILKQITIETQELLEKIDSVSKYISRYHGDDISILKNIVETNDNITSILILDKKGIITDFFAEDNANIYKGFDYSNKQYFKEIVNGKEFFWSSLFFSTINESQSLSYSFKIKDKIGVIFIKLTDIESLIKVFKNSDDSYMIRMYDNDGKVILNPDKPELQLRSVNELSQSVFIDLIHKVKPYEQSLFFKENSSARDFGMYVTIEQTGWSIIVRECYENILSNLKNIVISIVLTVLVFIVISIFIIVRINKILFASLDNLESISTNIAQGKYNSIINDSYFEEFGGLINGFKNMQHEIKKREISLEKSVESFEALINSTMEGLVLHENGVCFDANEVAVKLFGYERKDELIGKKILDFIAPSSLELVKSKMSVDSNPYEIKMVKKDGSEIETLVQGKFFEMNNKIVKASAVIDITDIKEKEKLLFQQSKMASMGEMIGNIAHQWRQPLSTISTASSGMKFQKEFGELKDEDFTVSMDAILKSTQYLSNTIDDFRNFFNADKQLVKFDVNRLIKKSLSLIDSSLKSYFINVHNEINEEVIIYGYKNEFIQAIMNIIANARDAFLTNNIKEENKLIIIDLKRNGSTVLLSIQDNAGGISEDIISKIFEPYFTTKHKSRGTGIGLYMTHQIITEHLEGEINVKNETFMFENKRYKGAKFTIKLSSEIKEEKQIT